MPASSSTPLPCDTLLAARQEAFERAWLAAATGGPPPCWADFLPPPGVPCSSAFLLLLLQTDIEYRLCTGQTVLSADGYFRHPRFQAVGVSLTPAEQAELIRWEYAERWQQGQRARRQEYVERFPLLADALADLIPRWNCSTCKRTGIPLADETAETVTCPSCGTTLPVAAVFATAQLDTPATGAAPQDHGVYELLERVGEGGMGEVYRTRDPRMGRDLAIKVIKVERCGQVAGERRIEREGRVAGSWLTVGLAAAVLAGVLLAAGGGFWLQHKEAQRQAEVAQRAAELRQGVEDDLKTAAALRDQARWTTARQVLEHVGERLGETGPADLRQRQEHMAAEVDLLEQFEAARVRSVTRVDGKSDRAGADQIYTAAFRTVGVAPEEETSPALAESLRQSPVKEQIVAALDDWAMQRLAQKAPVGAARLLRLAGQIDPDPWRNRFRDVKVWQDRTALEELIREAQERLTRSDDQAPELSPQFLVALGTAAVVNHCDPIPLWLAAQQRYPDDFWLALSLAWAFWQSKQYDQWITYSRAALALRPDKPVAWNTLGAGLADQGRLQEATAAFQTAIRLDPNYANSH
jgi:tetratricopeptide (TPR) repeat protein